MAASTDGVPAAPVAETRAAAAADDIWRRRLAVALAVIAALQALAILLVGSRGDPRFSLELNFVAIGFFGTIVLFAAIGAFIVLRRPRTRIAWVMIAIGTQGPSVAGPSFPVAIRAADGPRIIAHPARPASGSSRRSGCLSKSNRVVGGKAAVDYDPTAALAFMSRFR